MIDKELQAKFFAEYETPPHVQRHCNAVRDAAVKLAHAFNAAGYSLDVDLIAGAASVHDVARVYDKHAWVGADYLESKGFPREAHIVREHMTHRFHPIDEIDELDVVCMADRVVCEDQYVGIEARMEYLMNKPGMTDEHRVRIRKVMMDTKEYIVRIEVIIGATYDELLG